MFSSLFGMATGAAKTEGKNIFFDAAFDALKEILRPNMSLEEIAEDYSEEIDKIIIEELKTGSTFSAGKFKILSVGKNNFALDVELYFKDKDGKWIKRAKTSSPMSSEDWLNDDARKFLDAEKEKIFDVEAPEIEKDAEI
ncbi:MAG: hypothetical protein IK062_06580 [Selenomonadaceae bacterium]|nr:hypothetical protein [Selenomonadaceae bacterium]